jgi:hypothetical protein
MDNLITLKTSCAHCKSSKMEIYGVTLYGLHYYYRCLVCHKFTEYRAPFKNWLIISVIVLIIAAVSIAAFFFLLNINSTMAVAYSLICLLLLSIVCYKSGWFGYQAIALESLPNGIGIIRALPKRIRIIIAFIFIAILIGYLGLLILNLARQR